MEDRTYGTKTNQDSDYGYGDVVDTLVSMFGEVLSKDVIFTVVESCGGDLNQAAEAIVTITSDGNVATKKPEEPVIHSPMATALPPMTFTEDRCDKNMTISAGHMNSNSQVPTSQPIMSYSGASQRTGAVPKSEQNPSTSYLNQPVVDYNIWSDQLRRIITYHNNGARVLVVMRGVPGAGKTHLARHLVDCMTGNAIAGYNTHIYSTDDYFIVGGVYYYDRYKLSEAHGWNQKRVSAVLKQGLSPVIVDNTNVEIWEMEPYVRAGVRNGYFIEVIESSTPWAKKPHQLFKRNSHNVPFATIKKMVDNFVGGLTGAFLIKNYELTYPANFKPPVLRTTPPLHNFNENVPSQPVQIQIQEACSSSNNIVHNHEQKSVIKSTNSQHHARSDADSTQLHTNAGKSGEIDKACGEIHTQNKYVEIQKQLEEIEKVEREWENGESWGEGKVQIVRPNNESNIAIPKPPRSNNETETARTDKILDNVKKCDDWSQIAMYLPPWTTDTPLKPISNDKISVETMSSSTCMEIGDTDIMTNKQKFKILPALPRDINFLNASSFHQKIPEKRMLDKSTMTNELLIMPFNKCKNVEQHFVAFRRLFRKFPKVALRDVFDNCCGDVNWAVDIIIRSKEINQLESAEEISDGEEDTKEPCNCLAFYGIVPDTRNTEKAANKEILPAKTDSSLLLQKKVKTVPSENSAQLKRQIENNINISDEHYSKHCLKIRKMRRGENSVEDNDLSNISSPVLSEQNTSVDFDDSLQVTSTEIGATCLNYNKSDDEESNSGSIDEPEKTVNMIVGKEFIMHLDEMFGRKGMSYPPNIVPRISIPVSLLNEINAFWMESLMFQLDEMDKQTAIMIQEDEEFARQLAAKEAELASQGKEPEVPNFKEIMDMDLAISLYQKDVAEWRNKESNDMASRMSRDKLHHLFPDISQDILSELLMAHDNNFQDTVEGLLMSTGKADILQQENGLNKFVMQKEMERQEKILEEERKAISEVEWPLLPKGEKVEMSAVQAYRDEAAKHLARRNAHYLKAQEFIHRGMTQVAAYYSEVAAYHKQKYEHANSLAAVSLVQVNASSRDNTTIDLHYLRVGEARESLDLFLDTHIQKLKETLNRGSRVVTLYFITGRGLHSPAGKPRIKPAVKKRLKERGFSVTERNPGLLTTQVSASDMLSYQVQVPATLAVMGSQSG